MKKTITNIQTHFVELCSKLLRRNAEMASNEGTDHSGSSLSNRLAKHFVACSAAVAMAAGTVGDASAAVVTWNANLVIPATIDGLYINVQTQATGSAGSVVAGWDINPYSATSLTWFNATGTGMMRFPGATTGSAGNLAIGTMVGGTGSYGSGAVVVGANPGNWQLNATNYFGFRFIAADGLTHYGWGSMLVGAAITTRSITYLAYENLPTTSIPVGSGVVPICSAPTLSASAVAAVCQGSANGSVNLTITGGSPTPLSILWSNGATSEDLSNVAAGTYTVTVTTQGGGCSATNTLAVADGPAPTLWYADSDGDGYGNAASSQSSCTQPSGYVANNTDCNDSNSSANPGVASDGCDGVDNDCDGSTDEDATLSNYYVDADGDGYGAGAATSSCSAIAGSVTDNTDCNDGDNSVNPGVAADLCNGVDNDCDGSTDEDATFSNYYVDADGDGYGAGAATSSCAPVAGSVTVDGDCDDLSASVNPAGTEVCNSIDDDCDGSTDEGTTPVAGAISGNATGCVSVVTGSATYSIAALANASTYSWTVPTGMTIFSGQGTNSIFVTWTPGAVSNGLIGSVTVTPSNACGAGTSSSLAVDLNYTLPVRPSSISGPVRLCPGDNATYSVANVARATSYVWTLPTGMTLVSGAGTNVINVSIDGSYTGGTIACSAANACGTGPDRTRNLSVNTPAASASISGAVTGVCGANGVTYTAAAVLGATGYNWTVPAGASIVSGQGTSSISVDFTGAYAGGSISVAASNSCGTGAARSLSVSGAPGQPGAISGDVTICPGQSGVNYSVTTVAGAANYLWVVPGGAAITSGQGTKDIVVTWGTNQTSGLNMLVSASNGCGTGSTRVLNGISINVSNCVRVGEQGIATGLNLFPNPTSDRATVQFNGTDGADFRLRVVDVAGRILLNEAGTAAAGLNQREVSVRGMSAGIYFVVIETAGVTEQIRMIVE